MSNVEGWDIGRTREGLVVAKSNGEIKNGAHLHAGIIPLNDKLLRSLGIPIDAQTLKDVLKRAEIDAKKAHPVWIDGPVVNLQSEPVEHYTLFQTMEKARQYVAVMSEVYEHMRRETGDGFRYPNIWTVINDAGYRINNHAINKPGLDISQTMSFYYSLGHGHRVYSDTGSVLVPPDLDLSKAEYYWSTIDLGEFNPKADLARVAELVELNKEIYASGMRSSDWIGMGLALPERDLVFDVRRMNYKGNTIPAEGEMAYLSRFRGSFSNDPVNCDILIGASLGAIPNHARW